MDNIEEFLFTEDEEFDEMPCMCFCYCNNDAADGYDRCEDCLDGDHNDMLD